MLFRSYNSSALSNSYDTLGGKFLFDGGGSFTQTFYVAGIDMLGTNAIPVGGVINATNAFGGSFDVIGFSNNFALGTLEVAAGSILQLTDAFISDGRKAGLYLNNIVLGSGATLIVNSNVEVYYFGTNGSQALSITLGANSGGNVIIMDGGSFHQIIPEPSVLLLLTAGASAVTWWWRRRSRR